MNKNVRLLYGFSFFDQFMIVIPLLVPYLGTKGISMTEFMQLQAVFAAVIVLGQLPTGLLSDLWGRKKTLLIGAMLKALAFSMLPFWNDYTGFLVYHVTMGLALSTISGGDVALLYESYLAAGGDKARGTAVLGNARLAAQTGAAVSALLAGVLVLFSYERLLWANAILGWVPVLIVLSLVEPDVRQGRAKPTLQAFRNVLTEVVARDTITRLVLLNMVFAGITGLVMVWTNQRYWQESGVSLAWFGVLYGGLNMIVGLAGRLTAPAEARFGRRAVLAAVGLFPVVGYAGMVAFFGWAGILLYTLVQVGRGLGDILFLTILNERIDSTFRATVISLATLAIRALFAIIGPVVGYGIDGYGLPTVLTTIALVFSLSFVFLLLPLALRTPSQPSVR